MNTLPYLENPMLPFVPGQTLRNRSIILAIRPEPAKNEGWIVLAFPHESVSAATYCVWRIDRAGNAYGGEYIDDFTIAAEAYASR